MGRGAATNNIRPGRRTGKSGYVGNTNRFDRIEATVDAFEWAVTSINGRNNARHRSYKALVRLEPRMYYKYREPKSSISCKVGGGALIRFTYVVNTSSKVAIFPPKLMETKILGYGRNSNGVLSKLKKGIQHGNFGHSPRDYQVVYRYLWIPQVDIDSRKWAR